MLDIKTIVISVVVTNFTSFLAILILYFSRFPVKGISWWVVGRFFTSLGLFLVYLRELLPAFFTIVLGNGMMITGNMLVWLGMRQFVGRMRITWKFFIPLFCLLSFAYTGLYWYQAVNPILWVRILIITSSLALTSALTAKDLITSTNPTPTIKITGASYLINFLVLTICSIIIVKKTPTGPLMSSGPLLGVMYMYAMVFGIVLTFAMILMISQELQRQLAIQATLDPLTGIYNRTAMHMLAEHDFEMMIRKKTNMSAIMIDLDFFKKINDRYGHKVGDLMLIHFTTIVREIVRKEDLFFRYGGEEFVVLMPHTDSQGASLLAERIRKICSVTPLQVDGVSVKFTVSIGQASTKLDDNEISQAIDRADQALYQAKEQGRNRVVAYDSSLP